MTARPFTIIGCLLIMGYGCAASTPTEADTGASPIDSGIDTGIDTGMDAAQPDDGPLVIDADAAMETGRDGDTGNGAVDVVCRKLEMQCGGACVDLRTSVLHCGSCGMPCTAPPNATSVCEAGRCRFDCNTGYHRCGDACVSNESPETCGTRCTACLPPPGGRAVCRMGMCAEDCGFLANCGGTCVDVTTNAAHCGRCGNPCTAGRVCVDGTCVCPVGQGFCGGACMDTAMNLSHCGACDSPCRTMDPNATAVCVGGTCMVSCRAGYHLCGGTCVDNTRVETCGTRCATCADCPANADPVCEGEMCRCRCRTGYVEVGGACVAIEAPRPVAPLSGSVVTSLRPTFRWNLPARVDGAQVEICRQRGCSTILMTFPATGSFARPAADLPASTVLYWRLRGRVGGNTGVAASPVWQFIVGARSAITADTSWGTALQDIDGDGYADIVAGADGEDHAYVYPGVMMGMPARTVTLTGPAGAGNAFGFPISMGDTNNDGHADVSISALSFGVSVGRAYLFPGRPSGLSATPMPTLRAPSGASLFGRGSVMADFNGDTFADLALGAYTTGGGDGAVHIYRGAASGLPETPSQSLASPAGGSFGYALAAGDVNGDGFPDLVAGSNGASGAAGRIDVYYGNPSDLPTSPSLTRTPPAGMANGVGASLATADVNGDGYADIVAGGNCTYLTGCASSAGAVHVFLGGPGGPAESPTTTLNDPGGGAEYGRFLATTDFNGDGFGDVAVGAPGGSGRVYLYLGSSAGLRTAPAARWDGMHGGRFGLVADIGDINGDGHGDIGVGAPEALGTGRVYIFLGGAMVPTSPAYTLTATTPNGRFGEGLASAAEHRSRSRRVLGG